MIFIPINPKLSIDPIGYVLQYSDEMINQSIITDNYILCGHGFTTNVCKFHLLELATFDSDLRNLLKEEIF